MPEAMSVFGPVRAHDVRSLAGPVVDVEVPAGTELVREGSPIGTFFVIRSGAATVVSGDRILGTLGTGDCFGEIDPISAEPQTYGIITAAPTRLLTFSAFGISRFCEAMPGARDRIVHRLPSRTAEVHSLADGARSRAAARAPRAPRGSTASA